MDLFGCCPAEANRRFAKVAQSATKREAFSAGRRRDIFEKGALFYIRLIKKTYVIAFHICL